MKRTFFTTLFAAALVFANSARAGTMAWDVTGAKTFGTLDLTNGDFHLISEMPFQGAGIGEIGNVLYTAPEGSTELYMMDPATGAVTPVGNATISYFALGSTNTSLYMVDTLGALWKINPQTGTSSWVGSTHLDLTNMRALTLSAGSNTLYLTLNNDIYTVNPTTGAATYIGSSGSTDFGAIVNLGDKVYANTIVAPNSVYMFNPATGVSSFVALSNAPDYSWGLAPIVPEPGSFGMLAVAAAALGGFVWRRKRNAHISDSISGKAQV